jgi:hypothetical protein
MKPKLRFFRIRAKRRGKPTINVAQFALHESIPTALFIDLSVQASAGCIAVRWAGAPAPLLIRPGESLVLELKNAPRKPRSA